MHQIRVLYFEGCPNHPPAVEMAERLVSQHGLHATVEQVEIGPEDVVQCRFLGSPTIQVDGVDIEPAARERTDYAMSCRVYATPDGLPSEELLLMALGANAASGKEPPPDRAGPLAIAGSVFTASLSSACCWLPLLLLAFGSSAAGVSAFFDQWRPVFIVVAITSLTLGFYLTYFRRAACAEGCCDRVFMRPGRVQRATLWGSVVVVLAFVFFPNYLSLLLDLKNPAPVDNASAVVGLNTREYIFDIDGMTCSGCAATMQRGLAKLDGVVEARVNYEEKTAWVRASGDSIDERIIAEVSRFGFVATLDAE